MAKDVYEDDFGGGPVRYVIANNGRLLYEQKRHLRPRTWQRQVTNGLRKAGFPEKGIPQVLRNVWTENNYFNRTFFRPPWAVVQEQIELFYG